MARRRQTRPRVGRGVREVGKVGRADPHYRPVVDSEEDDSEVITLTYRAEPKMTLEALQDVRVVEVKAAAGRTILARFPDWKQRNLTARQAELQAIVAGTALQADGTFASPRDLTTDEMAELAEIRAAWEWIEAVRTESDAIETEIAVEDDLCRARCARLVEPLAGPDVVTDRVRVYLSVALALAAGVFVGWGASGGGRTPARGGRGVVRSSSRASAQSGGWLMLYLSPADAPWDAARWPNFSPFEPNLACPCCGEFWFDPAMLDGLQAIRDAAGPIRVTSGHRCAIHNAQVGGAPLSQHKTVAWDIALAGLDRAAVYRAAAEAGFTGFGFAVSFLHVDGGRPRRWFYGPRSIAVWRPILKGGPMDWLSDLLGFGASVASGGLFGLLGAGIKVVANYFQEKQRQDWQREVWANERELQKLQIEARKAETEMEIALASSQGAWSGLDSSIAADKYLTGKTHTWVNDVKSLFRPFLTTLLVAVVGWMFWLVLGSLAGTRNTVLTDAFTVAELQAIVRYMVYTMTFSAATAIVWWFGERAFAPPGMKNR